MLESASRNLDIRICILPHLAKSANILFAVAITERYYSNCVSEEAMVSSIYIHQISTTIFDAHVQAQRP